MFSEGACGGVVFKNSASGFAEEEPPPPAAGVCAFPSVSFNLHIYKSKFFISTREILLDFFDGLCVLRWLC